MYAKVKDLGANFFIARHKSNYLGDGVFKNAYCFNEDLKVVPYGRVKADVVYNKGAFPYDDVACLNELDIQNLVTKKQKVYDLLPEISPDSFLVKDEERFVEVMKKYGEKELVVVKPNYGACGRGVCIKSKSYHLKNIPDDLNDGYIVQDFLDSSVGIKGLVDGIHDFRVTLMNSQHVSTLIRTPQKGRLISNFALGGNINVIPPDETPQRFVELARNIDKKVFSKISDHRLLAFDFANTPDGIRLIEVNDSVGLDIQEDAPHVEDCHRILAEKLVEMGQES